LKELKKLEEEQKKQTKILHQLAEEQPSHTNFQQQTLDMLEAQASHTDLVPAEQTLEDINELTEEQGKQADVMQQIAEEQASHRKVLEQILDMLEVEATSTGLPYSDDSASPTSLPLNYDLIDGTGLEHYSTSSESLPLDNDLKSKDPGYLFFGGKTWPEVYALLKQRFSSNHPALDAEEIRRCTENR
jgi:hypothetical protein